MKLNTVNVIEYHNEAVKAVHSFTDDEEGNKEAEALYTILAKENGWKKKDIEIGLEDGWLEDQGYQLFITHGE